MFIFSTYSISLAQSKYFIHLTSALGSPNLPHDVSSYDRRGKRERKQCRKYKPAVISKLLSLLSDETDLVICSKIIQAE